MKKYLFILLVGNALACTHPAPRYYNYDKWQLPGFGNLRFLYADPKEVKESQFVPDSTQSIGWRLKSYDVWTFSRQGDVVSRKTCFADSLCTETTMLYDKNGFQSETRFAGGGNATDSIACKKTIATRLMPDGRYVETTYNVQGKKTRYITFGEEGSSMTIESMPNGSGGKAHQKWIEEYDNFQVQSVKLFSDGREVSSIRYKYLGSFLKEVIQNEDGREAAKTMYTENAKGDPVRIITVVAHDTVYRAAIDYDYDNKGNWTRRRVIEGLVKNGVAGDTDSDDAKYTMSSREIKY